MVVKDCVREDGAPSKTSFEVVDRFVQKGESFSLVKAFPETGRKHQIRIPLAHAGYPIVGDKIYGLVPDAYLSICMGELTAEQSARLLFDCHALHASGLSIPLGDQIFEMVAPINSTMHEFCERGGVSSDLFPCEARVSEALEDGFIRAVCEEIDRVQESKRSNCSGSRRKWAALRSGR